MMVCLLLDRWQKQIYKKNFHLEKDQAIFPSIPSHFSLVTVFFLRGVRHHPILFTLFQLPFSSVFIILLFPFFPVLSLLCRPCLPLPPPSFLSTVASHYTLINLPSTTHLPHCSNQPLL